MKTENITILNKLRRFGLLIFGLALLPAALRAQTQINPPTNAPVPPGDYYNTAQIHLTNGFNAIPAAGQHWRFYITGSVIPTLDKTSVMTTVLKVPGITDPSQLVTLNKAYMIQSVQYFDGLNRPLQGIQVAGSPNGQDMVQPVAYNAIGREQYKYLPYASPTLVDGSYKSNALTPATGDLFKFYNPTGTGNSGDQQANGIVVNPSPFGQSQYEESPLDRVTQQGSPGTPWQLGGGHTVQLNYGSNDATDPAISIWTINSGGDGAATNSTYGLGQLFKTETTDEDGNSTYTFKDKDDRVVFKKFAAGTFIYYIYDAIGNLRYVIPPLPSDNTGSNTPVTMPATFTESDDIFKNFFYGYHYDSRLRQTAKKVPGKDWEYAVYNVLDQPILTQDANQKSMGIWMVTKYDAQGRIVMTGEYTSTADQTTLQGNANSNTVNLWETFTNAATNYGYTHVTYPDITTSSKVLTATYYDNYTVLTNTAVNPSAAIYTAPSAAVDTLLQTPTGLPVATLVNVLGTNDYLFSLTHYDTYGRAVKVMSQNYVGGSPAYNKYDTEESVYSFQSLPVSTVRKHYLPASSSPQLTINGWTVYDHINRVLASRQQFISPTVTGLINTLSKIKYNEAGQAMTKHLGSTNASTLPANSTFLQHIDYRYNERGWLSTINDPANLNDPNYPGVLDVFAERLDYNGNTYSYPSVNARYNGNISSLSWQTKVPAALVPAFPQEQRGYVFTYDALNQLRSSASQASIPSDTGFYNEALTYDALGNILTLTRRGGSRATTLDNLSYNYMNAGARSNKLMVVTDVGAVTESQASSYTYNANGSLITDSKKSIISTAPLVYNELDLPSLVTFTSTGKTLTYKYDATGKKLERITKTGATVNEDRVYDDGIEYAGTTASTMDFVQTAEGRAIPSSGAYNYQYQLEDHLGNVRALFADANNNGILTADEIIQFSDYYPFGREVNYNQNLSLNPPNNYKYNGKEFQTDLSEYDYGARFYDAVIGRWNVVDPMTEKYLISSPYQYAVNNPIEYLDLNGKELVAWANADAPGSIADIAANAQNGNKTLVRFDGSKAIDATTGLAYKGTDAFIASVSTALSNLNKTETGKELVDFAESQEDKINIQQTVKNGTSEDGLIVGWNPTNNNGGPTENGSNKKNTSRPGFIGLGHELAHVQDIFGGISDLGDWTAALDVNGQETYDRNGNKIMINNSEKYATFKENQLRMENGIPLRRSYDDFSDAPILDKNRNNRWFRANPIIVPRPRNLNFKFLLQKL